MSKVDKKRARLIEEIKESEAELLTAITKKAHSVTEVSVPTLTTRIKRLKADLAALK